MPKYYVSSGTLRVVIGGLYIKSPLDAAMEACLRKYTESTQAEPSIRVNEQGFDEHTSDKIFDTYEVLKKAGFKIE